MAAAPPAAAPGVSSGMPRAYRSSQYFRHDRMHAPSYAFRGSLHSSFLRPLASARWGRWVWERGGCQRLSRDAAGARVNGTQAAAAGRTYPCRCSTHRGRRSTPRGCPPSCWRRRLTWLLATCVWCSETVKVPTLIHHKLTASARFSTCKHANTVTTTLPHPIIAPTTWLWQVALAISRRQLVGTQVQQQLKAAVGPPHRRQYGRYRMLYIDDGTIRKGACSAFVQC